MVGGWLFVDVSLSFTVIPGPFIREGNVWLMVSPLTTVQVLLIGSFCRIMPRVDVCVLPHAAQ